MGIGVTLKSVDPKYTAEINDLNLLSQYINLQSIEGVNNVDEDIKFSNRRDLISCDGILDKERF
jgi:hypothetical protein